MRAFRKLLGLGASSAPERDTETVRRIAAELDRLEPDEARYLAAFACVLARVAHADLEISTQELDEMTRIVAGLGELGESRARLVVELVKTRQIDVGGTENYVVTRLFRELSDRGRRLGLLRCLLAVAAADDEISERESSEITQIGLELGLTRPDIVSARSEYRDRLAVLRSAPRAQ